MVYYAQRLDILSAGGEPACIVPVGDIVHENAARTTVTTQGRGALDGLTFTYNQAITSWDNPLSFIRNRTKTPLPRLNGTDEEADTPDAAAWSRDDSSSEGFTLVGWVNLTGVTGTLMGKYGGATQEWRAWLLSGVPRVELIDESAGVTIFRNGGTTLTTNRWYSYAATYAGTGGAAAADDINIYIDGVLDNGSATNNASYVAMEDLTGLVQVGNRPGAEFLDGMLGGGVLGPGFSHRILNGAEIAELYSLDLSVWKTMRSSLRRRA